MKNLIKILLLLLGFTCNSFSQKNVYNQINSAKRNLTTYPTFRPFTMTNSIQSVSSVLQPNNSSVQLSLDETVLTNIEASKPSYLKLSIPMTNKVNFVLELIPIEIFSPTFMVTNANDQVVQVSKGIHYKGIIEGDQNSLVSISIIDGKIAGLISFAKGNFNLGEMKNSSNYILYNDRDLITQQNFKCGVDDDDLKQMIEDDVKPQINAANVACRAVQVYFEADNSIYQAQGSTIPNTTTFVNTLFAQIATFYDNEGIVIQIPQLKVWDTADPYIATNTASAMLTAFGTQIGNTFNGDIAQLISTRFQDGGLAQLNVLCTKGKGVNTGINNTVVPLPTYSWNVGVIAHEMGHNFGSPHTHSCTWPGGAIDNCFTTEGGCPPGPAPVNGGTMMSYCHLNFSVGINFANGFGPLPGNLVRNRTQACLGSAVAPTNLTVLETYSTDALLAWTHTGGNFTVEYRIGNGAWTPVNLTTTSLQLGGLMANTTYNWRVKANCSVYSPEQQFTTNTTPPVNYCNVTYQTDACAVATGINDFIVGGVNYNPASGCSGTTGYSFNFTPTRNLVIGQNYSFTVNLLGTTNEMHVAIWIDFNKNGTFETTEKMFGSTTSSTTQFTGNFVIPANLTAVSNTRMRVVSVFFNQATDPCGNYGFGETEDFLVSINTGCSQTLSLLNPTDNIPSGNITKQASAVNGVINATNIVSGAGTRATFQAKVVNLSTGFRADNGTIFKAEVGGCN